MGDNVERPDTSSSKVIESIRAEVLNFVEFHEKTNRETIAEQARQLKELRAEVDSEIFQYDVIANAANEHLTVLDGEESECSLIKTAIENAGQDIRDVHILLTRVGVRERDDGETLRISQRLLLYMEAQREILRKARTRMHHQPDYSKDEGTHTADCVACLVEKAIAGVG